MPGDNREIDRAALGDLGHRAGPAALDQAREQLDPSRLREQPEELWIEEPVHVRTLPGGLFRG